MASILSLIRERLQAPPASEGVRQVNPLEQVDLAFVVDTTGSMGPFIDAARRQMIATLQGLTSAAPVQLRVAVVEYRDHPPQEYSFVSRAHDFHADLRAARDVIGALRPSGGGDEPEAVYDGLRTACNVLTWLPHSHKLAVLIGDSPPHGTGCNRDQFLAGCPCGLDMDAVTSLMEGAAISLYALPMRPAAEDSFRRLARFTGGESFPVQGGQAAIDALKALLAHEFADIGFDGQVLEASSAEEEWTVDGICQAVGATRERVSASLSRLGRRGLLQWG